MVVFKVLQLDAGTEQWLGFAKRKAQALIAGGALQEAFQRTLYPAQGVTVRMRAAFTGELWVVRLWISGGATRTIYLEPAPAVTLRAHTIFTDGAYLWPEFRSRLTSSIEESSTYKAWEFYDSAGLIWGSDSGTYSLSSDAQTGALTNWPQGPYLVFGAVVDSYTIIYSRIPFGESPAAVAAYSAYRAYYEAQTGLRKTRLWLTDREELASAIYSEESGSYTNRSIEGWSGGDWLQLWSYSPDDPKVGYINTAGHLASIDFGRPGELLTFTPPDDVDVPTETYGAGAAYTVNAYGAPVGALGDTGNFVVVTGFNAWSLYPAGHPHAGTPIAYSRTVVDGVTTYVNYPSGVTGGKFYSVINGTSEEPIYTSIADFASEEGLYPGAPDPWAFYRARWEAARSAAFAIFERRHARLASESVLPALLDRTMPHSIRRSIRLQYPASQRLVAKGSPTLTVETSTLEDPGITTYTRHVTFSYEVELEGGGVLAVSHETTGTRVDREITHDIMSTAVPGPITQFKTVLREFTNWCNWAASGDQANEPGPGVLSLSHTGRFWRDNAEDEDPLLHIVNGVQYVFTEIHSEAIALAYGITKPLSTTMASSGHEITPPFLYTPAAAWPTANNPRAFHDVPPLTAEPWDKYLEFRERVGVTYIPETAPPPPEGVAPSSDLLDTHPLSDVTLLLFGVTTTHPEHGDLGLFPPSADQADEGCQMTVVFAHRYRYLFDSGDFEFVESLLAAPYVLPAYPPGVPGLVVKTDLPGSSPPDLFEWAAERKLNPYRTLAGTQFALEDPTVKTRDANGNPTAWYTHLGGYLASPFTPDSPGYPDEEEMLTYRHTAIKAWFYAQLHAAIAQ